MTMRMGGGRYAGVCRQTVDYRSPVLKAEAFTPKRKVITHTLKLEDARIEEAATRRFARFDIKAVKLNRVGETPLNFRVEIPSVTLLDAIKAGYKARVRIRYSELETPDPVTGTRVWIRSAKLIGVES